MCDKTGIKFRENALNDQLYKTSFLDDIGQSECVLKPKTAEEISQILSFCNDNNLAVAPQGGNTSLVGGSVPVHDEVVLSLSQMNSILNIDDTSGIFI